MKTIKQYDVIRKMIINKSNTNDAIIFKDGGRVYFIDRAHPGGYSELSEDMVSEEITVVVVKEGETVGFVSLLINNMPVLDYLDSIKDYTVDMYDIDKLHTTERHLYNYHNNHSTGYISYMSEPVMLTGARESKLQLIESDDDGEYSESTQEIVNLLYIHQFLLDNARIN